MPLYRIEYDTRLTAGQQDELADAITTLHSERFLTARLFVNVEFVDVSNATRYIAGQRRGGNHIRGNVRTGPARTQKDWDDLCHDIEAAWDRIVRPGLAKMKRNDKDVASTELRSVIIIAGLIAGSEAGFTLPQAGSDAQWMKENWAAFNKKADEGDQDFIDMVKEIKQRGILEKINGTNGVHA
ncbi:putative oxalocrotonate tautomerase enzyme [Acrodontium crateriforme]|uniref:Oxalocrotonate tautomerase enzyme n=1 Tax=Acrodontium crateriforme TaxID=150365 RepID=A0AAQ3RAN3_9PEZI|nr:putative oxalocrotonate tautomerase enzyme [Acrodontium crateriforme]